MLIHYHFRMTSSGTPYDLRVEMRDVDNKYRTAIYRNFVMSGAPDYQISYDAVESNRNYYVRDALDQAKGKSFAVDQCPETFGVGSAGW